MHRQYEEQLRLLQKAQRGDKQAKEQLVRENQALVWSIVKRYTGRGTEAEDLFQLGSIGLLKAIQGFDCAYGTKFSTYAVPKIAGEIRRFLRDDGTIKISRTIKELGYRISTARQTLHQTLQRSPTVSELAEFLDVTPEEIASCETALLPADSLQREIGEDGTTLEQLLGDQRMEESILESLSLREAMQQLDARAQQVLLLRYFRGQTQQACARQLGVSQVQVSRLERKAITRLRQILGEEEPSFTG